jgi:hypothetical protein
MKIPISLTYKFFDETITVKKRVEDLYIQETMDMYKNIMVPLFGERAYELSMIATADRIKNRRKRLGLWDKFVKFINEIK